MYLIWSEKSPCLSHLGTIWTTLGPNPMSLLTKGEKEPCSCSYLHQWSSLSPLSSRTCASQNTPTWCDFWTQDATDDQVHTQGSQMWAKVGQIDPNVGQIDKCGIFFRSDLKQFADLSHLEPIWTLLASQNVLTCDLKKIVDLSQLGANMTDFGVKSDIPVLGNPSKLCQGNWYLEPGMAN